MCIRDRNYLGKSTLWLDTYGQSTGHSGSYSTNNQMVLLPR